MKIVIAPDSFKDALRSYEVAFAFAEGARVHSAFLSLFQSDKAHAAADPYLSEDRCRRENETPVLSDRDDPETLPGAFTGRTEEVGVPPGNAEECRKASPVRV